MNLSNNSSAMRINVNTKRDIVSNSKSELKSFIDIRNLKGRAERVLLYNTAPSKLFFIQNNFSHCEKFKEDYRLWTSELMATIRMLPEYIGRNTESYVRLSELFNIDEEKLLHIPDEDRNKKVLCEDIIFWSNIVIDLGFGKVLDSLRRVGRLIESFTDQETQTSILDNPECKHIRKNIREIMHSGNGFKSFFGKSLKRQGVQRNRGEYCAERIRFNHQFFEDQSEVSLCDTPLRYFISRPHILNHPDGNIAHDTENMFEDFCDLWLTTYLSLSPEHFVWKEQYNLIRGIYNEDSDDDRFDRMSCYDC